MGIITRATPTPTKVTAPDRWDVGTFDEAAIAVAVRAASVLAGLPEDPNRIPTFWPEMDPMPTISEIDFGDLTIISATLAELWSSNRTVKRDRLLWHVQHPGQRLHDNPITTMPMVAETDRGVVIVDGHHSLGALWLLGAATAPVWALPMTPNSPNAAT